MDEPNPSDPDVVRAVTEAIGTLAEAKLMTDVVYKQPDRSPEHQANSVAIGEARSCWTGAGSMRLSTWGVFLVETLLDFVRGGRFLSGGLNCLRSVASRGVYWFVCSYLRLSRSSS
jgi:hypothetical protein